MIYMPNFYRNLERQQHHLRPDATTWSRTGFWFVFSPPPDQNFQHFLTRQHYLWRRWRLGLIQCNHPGSKRWERGACSKTPFFSKFGFSSFGHFFIQLISANCQCCHICWLITRQKLWNSRNLRNPSRLVQDSSEADLANWQIVRNWIENCHLSISLAANCFHRQEIPHLSFFFVNIYNRFQMRVQ